MSSCIERRESADYILHNSLTGFMLTIIILLFLPLVSLASEPAGDTVFHHEILKIGEQLPYWSSFPFIGMLLSIMLLSLFYKKFWDNNLHYISIAWAAILAIPFLYAYGSHGLFKLAEVLLIDYIPLMILLWGLFAVSGGILLRGTLVGTPLLNTLLLVIGTVLASWMGTTGASMLMIRPVLRANANRVNKAHVVIFFIFLVSNIGGVLTPLGDPPLFIGFLHGVPFFWTLRLFPIFLVVSVVVIGLFFLIDTWLYRSEIKAGSMLDSWRAGIPDRPDVEQELTIGRSGMPALQEPQQYKPLAEKSMEHMPIRIEGAHNFIFLAGILGSILVSGAKSIGGLTLFHIEFGYFDLLRDIFILLMGYLSIKFTSKAVRTDNDFSWEPIKEVGYLFFGIFVTIIPVLMMLKAGTSGHLGSILELVNTPGKYFWVTGGLSSFLDNAPTYYSFFTLALGQLGLTEPEASGILRGTFDHARSAEFIAYLKAISCGAVFMGANTYIGNAPNILVKSIAEDFKEGAVNMPGHLKYMAWSICLLIPCFLVVWLIFF